MIVVTVADAEDLNSKLVSDRAKVREEGLKALQAYLNSTAEASLWTILDQETAADQSRIRASSWPGLLHSLCVCIDNEVAASKKKGPKAQWAKILRNFVSKAEDSSRAGSNLKLLRKMKRLFQHVADILERVPTFVSDYNNVLCQLLLVSEYRIRMGKKTYADLLHLYADKAKSISRSAAAEASMAREEEFRNVSTFLSLVQYPPSDLPEVLLKDLTEDFIDIFSNLRDEGRIAKKLLAALDSFLIENGLNIGSDVAKIHVSVKPFLARVWLTRDRDIKDGLVLYARAQLSLRYILESDLDELSHLMELVEKDLDQGGLSSSGPSRLDSRRVEKFGFVSKSMRSIFELAAVLFFEGLNGSGNVSPKASKRRRKIEINILLKDRLMEGKHMWCGAFCLLIRRFGLRLSFEMVFYWLNGLASSLDRICLEAVNSRNFEGPIWIMRCLQELASLWGRLQTQQIIHLNAQADSAWLAVWNATIHCLPLLSNVQGMVEESFRLLGALAARSAVPECKVPSEFWDMHFFTERPSGNILYFLTTYFTQPSSQMITSDLAVRKKLLNWCLMSSDGQDVSKAHILFEEHLSPRLFSTALLAMTFGTFPGLSDIDGSRLGLRMELSWPNCESEPYLEPDEYEVAQEVDLSELNRSEFHLISTDGQSQQENTLSGSISQLTRRSTDELLERMSIGLLQSLALASDVNQLFNILQLVHFSTVVLGCIHGVVATTEKWGQLPDDWSCEGAIWTEFSITFLKSAALLCDILTMLNGDQATSFPSADSTAIIGHKSPLQLLTSRTTMRLLQEFSKSIQRCTTLTFGGVSNGFVDFHVTLREVAELAGKGFLSFSATDKAQPKGDGFVSGSHPRTSQNPNDSARLLDKDLDTDMESFAGGIIAVDSGSLLSSKNTFTATANSREKVAELRENLLQMITLIGILVPDAASETFTAMLLEAKDPKVKGEILSRFCEASNVSDRDYVRLVISAIDTMLTECRESESMRSLLLQALNKLFRSLLKSDRFSQLAAECDVLQQDEKGILPRLVFSQIAELICKIADLGLVSRHSRLILIEAIAHYVVLDPSSAQVLAERFLGLLRDPDYRVRILASRKAAVLFETWDGHDTLLEEFCSNVGVKIATLTEDRRFGVGDVLTGQQEAVMAETALLGLGEIAIASAKVERNAVFIICSHVSLNPSARQLSSAILNNVAKRLDYLDRWKYMAHLLPQVLTSWAVSTTSISRLTEVRELFVENSGEDFLQQCCPWLLPWLLHYKKIEEIQWLATVLSFSTSELLRQHFEPTIAGILPLHHDPNKKNQREADRTLRKSMLELADMSEVEQDRLIQKNMVQIVSLLFGLCTSTENKQPPYFPKERIIETIKTVVDGFLDSDPGYEDENVIDKMQVFRPDRVFKFILEFHFNLFDAKHSRHRKPWLSSIGALMHLLGARASVPSTFRYLLHVILESFESEELQEESCVLLTELLDQGDKFDENLSSENVGEQLQAIVTRLVSCCRKRLDKSKSFKSSSKRLLKRTVDNDTPSALSLLHRLTVDSRPSLHKYVKNLHPFPDYPYFETIRDFMDTICIKRTLAEDFVQLVEKIPLVPSDVRLSSVRKLQKQLRTQREELFIPAKDTDKHGKTRWRCSALVVDSVWKLVQFCDKHDDPTLKDLAGELLAMVGVGDPHAVVFHLPKTDFSEGITSISTDYLEISADRRLQSCNDESLLGVSDSLLRDIMLQLQGFLIDPDVNVIHHASMALKGILCTEKGQSVFVSMTKQERIYLEIFSHGVKLPIVERMVNSMKERSLGSAISLNDAALWKTTGKSHDVWVCTLTHTLVEHTEDTILRLCQDVLFLKPSLAELVFPTVWRVLARDHSPDSDLCISLSKQIEEHIFSGVNQSTRSIGIFLTALNSLRQHHIHTGMKRTPVSKRKDVYKSSTSGGSGGSRTRPRQSSSGSDNGSKSDNKSGSNAAEGLMDWSKVYWLHVDYLSTAKAAQRCAAHFTSVLYVEYYCDETFGSVTLGPPDFSSDDELPLHLELLVKVYTRINEPDGVYGVVRSHKVTSQLSRYEHEGNWSKALENYDLLLRMEDTLQFANSTGEQPPVLENVDLSVPARRPSLSNWQLQKGLMRSLQHNGCSYILQVYQCGISQRETGLLSDVEFNEMQFEAAWRSGLWESMRSVGDNISKVLGESQSETWELCFHSHLHSSLRSLRDGDLESFTCSTATARRGIVTHIAQTSLESTQNVNPLIVKLQMLACVSRAWEMRWIPQTPLQDSVDSGVLEYLGSTPFGPVGPPGEDITIFETIWQQNLDEMQGHYELAEPYAALHKVLLKLLNLDDHIPQHLLQFGSFSRKSSKFAKEVNALVESRIQSRPIAASLLIGYRYQARRLNHARTAIHELKSIFAHKTSMQNASEAVASQYCVAGRVEEAKILWAEGHQEMAVNLAKYVLQANREGTDVALLLCLTGKWLAETRSSSSRVILDSYLKRAVENSAFKVGNETKERTTIRTCRMHFRLAHYADALFRSHQERLMSSEWQAALRLRQHKAREYETLRERLLLLKTDRAEDPIKIREYSMKVLEMQRQLTIDADEARHLQDDKDHFLRVALENYRSCLCISGKYDLRVVFRMMALWFSLSTNEHVMKATVDTVQKVQSYKFLPLMYQIASRLGVPKESSKDFQALQAFQETLSSLLKKMAIEHPYHSLYQLFALANGDRVKEKQRGKNVFVVDMDKKRAAEELLSSLSNNHGALLSEVESLIEMYIRLAEMETTPKDPNKKLPLPRDIRSIRELQRVPVITAHIPIDHSCRYDQQNFAHFKGFAEGIKVMNGINAPKYIECLGSDGRKYRQLAKSGNDDLRQDAVMEQLFDLVNNLLQDHPDTRKRNLRIRTYKVVPFTPSAGVLEWVDGTIPLGEYLLGSDRLSGAHGRYGGDDWTFVACREQMCTGKDKRLAFDKVVENFRPVMHNFFLENFARAEDWFEKRLAYTRSVATSSMVGYIVGLGDRHSMNVLLDQASAEVVHIDLGVAFEQGLMLKTPERIPFRLTRDVVDGMGVTGVEGTYRRCCEATLSVLRTNKEALLTIVEVFIYDPLYNWALSPLKALQRQQELEDLDDSSADTDNFVDTEGNRDAARALFRVKQKLDGYEEGEMRSLQGQVQQLIQDAQDPERLCQLFPGWGAWV